MKKGSNKSCSEYSDEKSDCCKVESVITIDDRGQMVLPKEVRDSTEIRAGDKLAVISGKSDGKVSRIILIKIDELNGLVEDKLGLLLKKQ